MLRILSAIGAGAVLSVAACQSKSSHQKGTPASGNPCDDLSGLDDSEIDKRKKLGYVSETTVADKQCSSCKLYLPPETGSACGTCMLFKGPVNPNGACTYWAPKV